MSVSTINNALAAYAQVAKSVSGSDAPGAGEDVAASGDGVSFASLVKDGVKAVADAGHKSEEQTKLGLAGKADIRDVVSAVTNAEVTLQTVVAVRDKVIGAYNDILKMPI